MGDQLVATRSSDGGAVQNTEEAFAKGSFF